MSFDPRTGHVVLFVIPSRLSPQHPAHSHYLQQLLGVLRVTYTSSHLVISQGHVYYLLIRHSLRSEPLSGVIMSLLRSVRPSTLHFSPRVAQFESLLGNWLYSLRFFVVILSPSKKYTWIVPRLGYDCFLPNFFQFLNHPTIPSCIIYTYILTAS